MNPLRRCRRVSSGIFLRRRGDRASFDDPPKKDELVDYQSASEIEPNVCNKNDDDDVVGQLFSGLNASGNAVILIFNINDKYN